MRRSFCLSCFELILFFLCWMLTCSGMVLAETGRRFFSDDIVVFGRDQSGKEILLTLMFCRKEDAAQRNFLHYRFASLIFASTNVDISDSFSDVREEEIPHDFLTAYEHHRAKDLSTRESYALSVLLGGSSLELRIPELHGDFVVKSVPDYTKLVSESPAELRINGVPYAVRAVVERIYSADFSRSVFFPGYGKTRSETNAFVLWDSKGHFYMLDSSVVSEDNPAYRSHTWALYKDTARNLFGKAFEAHIAASIHAGEPPTWRISIPALRVRELTLKGIRAKDGKPEEGIASGSIQVDGETRSVAGMYTHHVYR